MAMKPEREQRPTLRPSVALNEHRDEVIAIVRAAGFKNLRVFGSVARGEDRAGSDIDLLVTFPPKTSLLDVIEVEQALEEVLGCKVEILGEAALEKPQVAERIKQDLIAL